MMKLARTFSLVLFLGAMIFIIGACSKEDDEFDLSSGNLSGWWISEEVHPEGGNCSYVYAWHFYDNTSEGEYMLWDSKDSGHSKNAFGKWYMNNTICVDWPYHVEGTKVYINTTHRLNIVDGKLVDISSGRFYTRQ